MSAPRAGQPTAENISDETLDDLQKRLQGFPVPDGLFDPSIASPALLREYGLPPRPDPNSQPLLRQVWDRGFGAPLTLKEFQFDRGLVEATKYRLHFRQADELAFAETRFETSLNWSGAYITANRDRQFLQIWGVWKIPDNLRLPPAPFQGPVDVDYICSNWIGLDGQRLYFDSSLPQIGTSLTLPAGGGPITAQAWIQWWARGMDTVPVPLGLAVAPRNQVLSVLTAWDPQTVILVMVNLSTMQAQAVEATAPMIKLDATMATPQIAGATAEWIVERPRIPGKKELYNFPDYGHSEFDFCVAVEGEGVDIFSLFAGLPRQLQAARRIRMFEVLLNPARTAFISMPRKLHNTSVHLRYGGFPG